MNIYKSNQGYQICLAPKKLTQMVTSAFFVRLFSNKKLYNKSYNSKEVKEFIQELSKKTVDSQECEYYTELLELYYLFNKNCDFCFKLKDSYNPKKDSIRTINDLTKFRDETPDVIVRYQKLEYYFELKRYRGEVTFEAIYNFVKRKIINHYSEKLNFLITLQPQIGSLIDLDIFKKIHEKLRREKKQPGVIGFTFNHDNKEIFTVRICPKLEKYVRPYNMETDLFSNLLN